MLPAMLNSNPNNDNEVVEELNKLAYAVSHDMGAPLRHVRGFTEILERNTHGLLDEYADHYLHHLKSAVEKLDYMMDGMLKYSCITSYGEPPRLVNSNDTIAEVVSELMASYPQEAVVSYDQLPNIQGDHGQFKLLWEALIENAILYAKPGKLADITITCETLGENWIFTINDKGMGIDPKITRDIFTMFYRGVLEKDFPDGHGVGLALCERIVERHGGRIWCESEEGTGSCFYIVWPMNVSDITPLNTH